MEEDILRVCPDDPFASVVSARLGRTVSKEQYGFMYRPSRVQVAGTYQFDDGEDDGTDVFQREPYAVRFTSPTTEMEDFAIIATHTDPDEAAKEVGALDKVYFATKKHWDLEDILIAGDFNADESYMSRSDWDSIGLRQDKRFKWLIDDSTDTTTSNTDRAYDRFVVAGEKMTKAVVPGKTGVFLFDKEFNLSYYQAKAVSDHYPIEMQFRGKVNRELQSTLDTGISVVVKQNTPIDDVNDVRQIYRADFGAESANFKTIVNKDDSKMIEVVATREDAGDVIAALREFQVAFPNVVRNRTVEMVRAYLDGSNVLKPPSSPLHPYVYGLALNTSWDSGDATSPCKRGAYDLTISASLQDPLLCSVTVTMRMS